jgi:general secretion pathway protein B
MSYILEALKKAQAERQLGSAPTIHAPVIHAAPADARARKPALFALAACALSLGGALVLFRQQGPAAPAQTVATVQQGASVPHEPHEPPASTRPVEPRTEPARAADRKVALLPERADRPAPHAAVAGPSRPVFAAPAPQKPLAVPSGPVQPGGPAASAPAAPAAAISASPEARPAQAETPHAAPAAEETLRTLAELPEAVRRDVPKVSFGGYMYSPNPADRLVLVDKTLRREGEEVAPGLLLEKLLPKGAVLNYRGYRYRVPF